MADFNVVQEPGTYDSAYYTSANGGGTSTQGNGFDFNSISSGVSQIATPLFNFITGMYAVSQGKPSPQYNGTNGPMVYTQPQPQTSAASTQTLMYVVGGVFFLLVLGLIVYALKKN